MKSDDVTGKLSQFHLDQRDNGYLLYFRIENVICTNHEKTHRHKEKHQSEQKNIKQTTAQWPDICYHNFDSKHVYRT